MGFGWGDLGAVALAPVTGGASLVLKNQWDKRNKGVGQNPNIAPRDPLLASDVSLLEPLQKPLKGYQDKAQNSLASALGAEQNQAATSARASGRVMGDYTGKQLGRANNLATQEINNALAKILGDTSLKYKQNELGYQNDMALARRIGQLNKPSTWEEIMAGLGGGANTALQGAALYQALNKGKTSYTPQSTPNYDYYNSGGSGLNLYGY